MLFMPTVSDTECVPVDPYQKAAGGETVLHWACQSKIMDEKLLQLLLVK